MISNSFITIFTISLLCLTAESQYILSNHFYTNPVIKYDVADQIITELKYLEELSYQQKETVKIEVYYECLCPDCRLFDSLHLIPTIKKLGDLLEVDVYPYGNARTIIHEDGSTEIKCQHGPPECYGNMLHACALNKIINKTEAIFFNACMMDFARKNKGSDDDAANTCGLLRHIDADPIKKCANGPLGFMLLKSYGEISKKADFNAVPYILVNGVENDGNHFFEDVCSAFKVRPNECNE